MINLAVQCTPELARDMQRTDCPVLLFMRCQAVHRDRSDTTDSLSAVVGSPMLNRSKSIVASDMLCAFSRQTTVGAHTGGLVGHKVDKHETTHKHCAVNLNLLPESLFLESGSPLCGVLLSCHSRRKTMQQAFSGTTI